MFPSRQIERSTHADVTVRFVCANIHPGHDPMQIPHYELIEFNGFRDIYWGFSNSADAIESAEGLLEFAALEDVTKLTVLGESIGRKVYKDTIVGLLK